MIQNVLNYLRLFFFVVPGIVSAQTIPMTVDIRQPAQFSKGNGPVSFVWQCSVSTPGLLEGYFLVKAHDGNEQFGEFKSNDVALHSGFHEIPMMLPPIKVDNPYSEISLKLSFISGRERYDFEDEYTVRVGQVSQRTFAIGICDPFDISLDPKFRKFLDGLKFESISPDDPVTINVSRDIPRDLRRHSNFNMQMLNQSMSLNVKTVSINIPPPDFPKLPIDCHQYDILVITARGLGQLETRQLKAIHQWVRSGGSLCVLVGEDLEQSKIQFLNSLAEDQESPLFLMNVDGKLKHDRNQQIWFQRTGWGRSVIALSEAIQHESLTADERNQIPFYLWKVKESQKAYFEKEKKWDYRPAINFFLEQETRNGYVNSYALHEALSLNYRPIFTGGAVATSLMPAEMRLLPTWVMAVILFSYVVIIGPGEYYLLGKFRIRRFTWITFPLISICFACLAFLVSNYYMQTSHERKNLNIVDLDMHGKPVKENQIELLFTGSYQKIETKVKSGLLTPMKNTESRDERAYNRYAEYKSESLVGPPYYSGSIPTQYSVFQLMPQWTPQVNRIIRNYPSELKSKYDWSSIHVNQLGTEEGRLKLQDQIQNAFGNRAKLLIYKGLPNGQFKNFDLSGSDGYYGNNNRFEKDNILFNKITQNDYSYPGHRQESHSFMDDLCVRNQRGLFQIVSQTSPSGGKNYEDLSILDPSDTNQWLVVVYVPGNEQDTIYRQFFVSIP